MAGTDHDTETDSGFAAPDVSGIEELLSVFLDPSRPYLTDSEIADGVLALDRVRCLVDAALSTGVDRLDGQGVYGYDGSRSAPVWLKARTELSDTDARGLVYRARDLRLCPHVAESFNNGLLGATKVRMLLSARNGLEVGFTDFEAELVGLVRDLTVDQARIVIAKWRQAAQTEAQAAAAEAGDGEIPPPSDPEEGNRAHLSPHFGGRFRLDGDFDPVNGQMMADAISARIDELFRTGVAFAGDGVKHSHRVAQVIVELMLRGAQPGSTKHGAPRPSVTFNLDLNALLGLPVGSPEELLARSCGLTNGTPISRSAAERLMCNADITVILTQLGLDGIIEPLGAAHTSRNPTATERRALALRDQGCVFPGCGAPVDWADAHHLDHWHLHRRTQLGRLVLLCRFHHHQVHEGGYRLERGPTGVITVTRPDGTTLPHDGAGRLIPDEPEPPPQRGPTIPAAPGRFRTTAQRQTAAEREADWWGEQTKPRIDALIAQANRRAS